MADEDFHEDELIEIKLPRHEYELLKEMLKKEKAYSWLGSKLRHSLVWIIAGGALSVWALWEHIAGLLK